MTSANPSVSKEAILAKLKAISPPLEPGFWPPSWEFWLIVCIVVVALAGLTLCFIRWRGPLWFRTAQRQLNQAHQALLQKPDQASLLTLNQTLKQIAITTHGRDIAHLAGQAWCKWLDHQGNCNHFTQGVGQCLGEQVYNPKILLSKESAQVLKSNINDWLQQQKPSKLPKLPKLSKLSKLSKPKKPSNLEQPKRSKKPRKLKKPKSNQSTQQPAEAKQ